MTGFQRLANFEVVPLSSEQLLYFEGDKRQLALLCQTDVSPTTNPELLHAAPRLYIEDSLCPEEKTGK